ncbi:MAG TPA: nucleotidyltransferase domain-containing protein [Methanosarcinales archaeon]|nr:nucleotidyltransferase domain-containing protein [Methanosarcinales archaeon]
MIYTKKEIIEKIKHEVNKYDSISAAIIFGSFLTKEFRDIDLLIILNTSEDWNIKDALDKLSTEIGVKIDPTFVSEESFKQSIRIGNPFYLNVMKGDTIIGEELIKECKKNISGLTKEIEEQYYLFSKNAYDIAKETRKYFDCYVACKFLIEFLKMRFLGTFVEDPHKYKEYLQELIPYINLNKRDIKILERILMHRRSDRKLKKGDNFKVIRIIKGILEGITHDISD